MRISDWSSDVCSSDLDGHFYADAQVGAATVHFLIDTGATAVALSRADAQRAGISPRAGEFTGTARTANGTVPLKPVTIDRIRIGPLEARNVAGARSEEHTSELQSLMRISYAVFCLKKKI